MESAWRLEGKVSVMGQYFESVYANHKQEEHHFALSLRFVRLIMARYMLLTHLDCL